MQVNLLRTESGDTHSAHFGADVIPHALDSHLKVVAHHFDGYWRVSRLLLLRLAYMQWTCQKALSFFSNLFCGECCDNIIWCLLRLLHQKLPSDPLINVAQSACRNSLHTQHKCISRSHK